jgi:phage terminase large subunit-like protein
MVNNADGPNHELYREWQTAGKLIVTPGARTSFATIMAKLREWRALFRISRFSFDPREMSYFVEQLQAQDWCDFPLVEVTQTPQMISQPMKELEALACAGLMHHNGDPVLTWMVGNVVQKSTISGNQTKTYFPARPSEHAKIDGAAALIMAVDGMLRAPPEQGGDPGVFFL